MEIKGLTLDQFTAIVRHVSEANYSGNLSVDRNAHDGSSPTIRCTARLTAKSGESGSRTTGSGRRGPYACWHAYRDVLVMLFEAHPDAKVKTALAVYDGAEGFRRDYPETKFHNAGSRMQPRSIADLCDCDG